MELGFKVDAGPLNQLGVQILSLDTAFHLAVSAYGWWKAKERSATLIELIRLKGAALISSSSFRADTYIDYRQQRGNFRGVVVQEGRVQSTSMPRASTATEGSSGQLCLRALTAGLLCHFEPAATVVILQEVISSELLNMDLEGEEIEIEGPLLASLRQYVVAIATEEDNDEYRRSVLREVNKLQAKVSGLSVEELNTFEPTRHDGGDAHLVIGFLKWMLRAKYRRQSVHYPTRSLRVWTVAATMSFFGFEVSACTEVVTSEPQYRSILASSVHNFTVAEVFLVAAQAGPTDLVNIKDNSPLGTSHRVRHQITTVRAIPWMAFRHFRERKGKQSTSYLSDVWMSAFKEAKSSVTDISLTAEGYCTFKLKDDGEANLNFHKELLRLFSPHLIRVCGRTVAQFVPTSEDENQWNINRITVQVRAMERDPIKGQDELKDIHLQTGSLVLTAIVLGIVYGIVCCTAYDTEEQLLGLDSELAFMPDLIFEPGSLHRWATFIGLALDNSAKYDAWTCLCHEMITGFKFVDGSSDVERAGGTTAIGSQNRALILGGQANGLAMISDTIVNPLRNADSILQFHIRRGQILNFPVDEDGLVRAAQYLRTTTTYAIVPDMNIKSLPSSNLVKREFSYRLDVEPCWEAEPNTVVLRIRKHGITIASPNIEVVLTNLMRKCAGCSCGRYSHDVLVFSAGRWGHVDATKIVKGLNKNSLLKLEIMSEDEKVLVDCRGDYSLIIACVGNIGVHHRNLVIADKCYDCAMDRANELRGPRVILLAL